MAKEIRILTIALSTFLIASIMTPFQGYSAQATSLTTCVNLVTGTERISHTGKCRMGQEAQANWHRLSLDSTLPDSNSSKQIVICSNKPSSPVTYKIIRQKCAAHQMREDYYRSKVIVAAPIVLKAVATGSQSAQVSLAKNEGDNPDAPVAYYTIISSKGQTKNVYSWGELNLTIDNLSELTTYSFTVTATTVDGTSKVSSGTESVTTPKYVAPISSKTVVAVAQVSLLSNDTASVTIPAGATSVAVVAPTLGNPSLSFGSQGAIISATITSAANPAGGISTPFTVSGSTKIIDIAVTGLSGSATVCLDASPSAKLWHYVGGAWIDITTSHTSTQVCGLTTSFSPFAGEEKLPQPSFTLSTNSRTGIRNGALSTVTATKNAHSQQVIYSVSPVLPVGLLLDTSTGSISGTPTVEALATDYVITATNAATETATQTINLTINPALGCGSGGECLLGDTGPGGGIIFYVSVAGFNCGSTWSATGSPTGGLCHNLEVAPKGWSGTTADPTAPTRIANMSTDISSIPNNYKCVSGDTVKPSTCSADFDYSDITQLGAGLYFTRLINDTDSGNTAARLAHNYKPTVSGLNFQDYYLPTLTELNLLCQWSKGIPTVPNTKCGPLISPNVINPESGLAGTNGAGTYQSSSEKFYLEYGSQREMVSWELTINLGNGNYSPPSESFGSWASEAWSVRPIRAF